MKLPMVSSNTATRDRFRVPQDQIARVVAVALVHEPALEVLLEVLEREGVELLDDR